MAFLYNLLKFVHVGAVVTWVGGVLALSVINARAGRRGDRLALAALARETAWYGRSVVAPALGVALLAGFGMAGVAHLPIKTPWIVWGILGAAGFFVIGAVLSGRSGAELGRLLASPSGDEVRIRRLQQRLAMLTASNLVLLFSVVWAMVAKPTF